MPHEKNRSRFPRGLDQPADGFRFGADTLLLAAFAGAHLRPGKPLTGLDLGTGCGAASLGLLLLRPELDLHLTGIDTGPEMLACAAQNADALGLAERFAPLLADAQDYRSPRRPGQGQGLDFVLANPPFRAPDTGRTCADTSKNRARFEGPGGFSAFARCAALNLRRGGQFFLVHLAERLPELFRALADAGLNPRRLLPVQGKADAPPKLALLLAVRGGGSGLDLQPPLILYGQDGTLTPQAAAYCPHLTANPHRNTRKPAG